MEPPPSKKKQRQHKGQNWKRHHNPIDSSRGGTQTRSRRWDNAGLSHRNTRQSAEAQLAMVLRSRTLKHHPSSSACQAAYEPESVARQIRNKRSTSFHWECCDAVNVLVRNLLHTKCLHFKMQSQSFVMSSRFCANRLPFCKLPNVGIEILMKNHVTCRFTHVLAHARLSWNGSHHAHLTSRSSRR